MKDSPAYGAWNVQKVAAGTGEALAGPVACECCRSDASYHRFRREVDGVPGGRRRGSWYCLSRADNTTAGEGRAPALSVRFSAGKGPVSALVASSTASDKVQVLQRTLYRAAKADPGRRFHALYDKVHRRDVLERA